MFRLDTLEIHGFKSFYDPANLTFPSALTAVVGPNGCGKSNICDALIWVLGENRASHIRGETMEDVIFQGSARRRPLSMGEVTLTLGTSNGDSNHPMADDGKITIHRRVFRDGQSVPPQRQARPDEGHLGHPDGHRPGDPQQLRDGA